MLLYDPQQGISMNKKVKQLAERAGASFHLEDPYSKFDPMLFAELLIKECARVGASSESLYSVQYDIHNYFGIK